MRTRLSGFVCYILVTLLFAAAKTSAQTNTNCTLVMTCPSNIVVTSCFNVQEFYTPTASNICCGVNSSVTCTPPSGSIFAVGTTTTVTCTATDCDQNTNFCTFTVTVVQGTNCATNCLDIQCPSNIVVMSCTNIQEFYAPTVTDSCCSNWNVTCTPPSGSYFAPNTTNLIICSVTDYCGMSNDCSFTLIVLQGTNCPTNCLQVECPTNKTIPCGTTNWSFDLPTATSCCTNLIGSSGVLTNVVITSLRIETNGTCQQVITQTWSIVDGCGNSNTCSQIVTVECCATNCINLICPSDIVVTTCSNCATVFYTVTATNGCCFSNVVLNYSLPSGYCFPLGTNTVTVTAHDPDCASTPPATCSFTVTVVQDTNCCGNLCCGPGVGPQTINWLQLPTNGSTLAPNSSGSNGAGTWIITNLPGYGNVLITQDPATNVEVLFTKDSPFDDTPNTNGLFEFTETGYGPYSWGTLPGWVDLYYNQVGPVPDYNVSFYFLDGPPSPCSLVLAVIADAQYTTNIVSQPVTFRTEFDLTNSFGQYLSAFTTLDGIFGPNLAPGVNGTVVDSAYSSNGVGSDFNTGFALFQPDGALLMTNLPSGNGTDVNGNSYPTPGTNVPYVSFTISHQPGDSFGLTVGYICCPPCPTNCLQIQCSSNKTVECGSTWAFDPPTATSCCTNEYSNPAGPVTNVLITPISTFTNGSCPQPITITQTWAITDLCGDSNTCSQTVTVIGCCSNSCSGPGMGLQSIQWLQLPTNTTRLQPNPSGANTGGTWIITNLPGYGNVLVTQNAPTNVIARCTNSDFGRIHAGGSFDNPPTSYGYFDFTETGYGPYTWGVLPGSVELAYGFPYTGNRNLPSYQVSFYFLNGQPNPGSLALAMIGLGQYTTNTISQPFTFRTEYDLLYDPVNYPQGPSADTVLDGTYGPPMIPGVTGTVVSSAFASNGGDDYNTGYAIFQPTNDLLTATLPSGSGFDVNLNPYPSLTNPCPYITITVDNHEIYDIFSLTVGYLCCTNCPTNCLQIFGTTNKTVQCGSNWMFDPPTATSCCTNEFVTGPATETNVLITAINTVTNGACPEPMQITQTWSIVDGCGDSNTWSQTVTVLGCCTNCLVVYCPSNKTVACDSGWTFDMPTATTCCTNEIDTELGVTNVLITPVSTITNGACPQPIIVTQTWSIVDACGNSNSCSQVVTVTGCCTNSTNSTNCCCGTNVGPRLIQWLQCPAANSTPLLADPSGTNTAGMWIITNLPCYGNVLVTQTFPDNSPDLMYWFLNPNLQNVPAAYGSFADVEGGYGPYSWGTYGSVLDFYNGQTNGSFINYNLNFYFLSNAPNPCALYLGVIGLAADTTATVSQPVVFRAEYDLQTNAPGGNGYASANTTLNSVFGPSVAGATGTIVGSAYNTNGVGDPVNTGWAVLQPTYALNTVSLPGGSGTDVNGNTYPAAGTYSCLTLTVNQQPGDGIGFTVGYVCCCTNCPTNCLEVECPTNKTVSCDSDWTFDAPTATSCCTNNEFSGGTGSLTNVLITPISTVTNGACPQLTITQTWSIVDGCGNSNTCSQMVTVTNCCTNCLQINCPTNKSAQCGSNWMFDAPTATSCCASNFPGTSTNVLITVTSTMTNGVCPQVITRNWAITDACGESNMCSQVVTVVDTTPPVITCPTNTVVVALNTNCQLVIPTVQVSATDNCTPLCSLVYSQSPTNGTIVSGTNATVTVTVTDLCGNSNSCQVLVEGKPETGPVVTVPASIIISNCVVPCLSNYLTATDNCCPASSLKITQSVPCGDLIASGGETVTVTVTDCHGNATTKTVHLVPTGSNTFLENLTNTGSMVSSYISVTTAPNPNNLLADGVRAVPYTLPSPALNLCASIPNDYSGYPVAVAVPYVPWTLAPDPANPASGAVSKWIAPDAVSNFLCPCGTYTYSLPFTLPAGLIANTATISGRWAADNGAVQMLINSTVTGNVMLPTDSYGDLDGFAQWTSFTINSGFLSGANTLQFVVTNQPFDGIMTSSTGLRVEFTSAYAGCAPCAAPSIISVSPAQSLQEYSTASFAVSAGGTAPLSYQWQLNNNNIAGATNSTLRLPSIGYAAAGLYSVIIANPCGVTTGLVRLTVTQPLPWPNGSWTVGTLANPLAATYGPDLVLTGSSYATNFAINVGTTEDFGLPGEGGQTVNVMDINPAAGGTIGLPLIAEPGSYSDTNYTLIMDIYEPDTSLGTPSTLFQSIACCISNLGSGGQDGVGLTLDASNYLHVTGAIGGTPFDDPAATPMTVDAWHRVALAVDGGLGGIGGSATLYSDGQTAVAYYPCLCCPLPVPVLWTNTGVVTNSMQVIGSPTLLSSPTDTLSTNGEFYVSGIQFHAIAMTPQMIAGIGSPASGPAPMNETSVGAAPVLSAALSNGVINLTWSGNAYTLQETTGLSSGIWINSSLPFTETGGTTGNIMTTATVTPATGGPSKFYRLVFSP